MRTVESYIAEFTAKKQNKTAGPLDCGLVELSHVRNRYYTVSQVDTTVTITVGRFSESFEMTKTKNGMYPHRQRVWKAMKLLNATISQPKWMLGRYDKDFYQAKYPKIAEENKLDLLYVSFADKFGVHVHDLLDKYESQFKLLSAIHHPDKGGDGHVFNEYVNARNSVKRMASQFFELTMKRINALEI